MINGISYNCIGFCHHVLLDESWFKRLGAFDSYFSQIPYLLSFEYIFLSLEPHFGQASSWWIVAQSKQTKLPAFDLDALYWYTIMNIKAAIHTSTRNNTSLNIPNRIVTIVAKIIVFRGVLFWDDLSFISIFSCFFYNNGGIEFDACEHRLIN